MFQKKKKNNTLFPFFAAITLMIFTVVFLSGCSVESLKAKQDIDGLITFFENKPHDICIDAVLALADIGEPAVTPLIEALNNEISSVRWYSARALGFIGDKRAIEPLSSLLDDESSTVRKEAVEALGKIGGPGAVGPLVIALSADTTMPEYHLAHDALSTYDNTYAEYVLDYLWSEDPDIREAANEALDLMGGIHVDTPQLIELLQHESEYAQEYSVAKLVEIGTLQPQEIIDEISPLLSETNVQVLKNVVLILGAIGSESNVESLISLLDHDDVALRQAIVQALDHIGEAGVDGLILALSDSNDEIRLTAVEALEDYQSNDVIEALIDILFDENEDVVESAITILGLNGDLRSIEPLILILIDEDNPNDYKAEWALSVICEEDPSILIPYLEKPATREVYRVLIRIGDSETIPDLIAALNESDDAHMANVYLNSGNTELENAAKTWANEHGYQILDLPGISNSSPSWGN